MLVIISCKDETKLKGRIVKFNCSDFFEVKCDFVSSDKKQKAEFILEYFEYLTLKAGGAVNVDGVTIHKYIKGIHDQKEFLEQGKE